MRKEIYLLEGEEKENYPGFSDRVISIGKEIATLTTVASLKVTFTSTPPPTFSIIPFKKKKVAVFSITHEGLGDLIQLTSAQGFAGSYTAVEAIPVAYEKSWENLQPTPGVCLLTFFKKRKDISYETFLDRWHNSHTPLSLKIHPLWNYNRNVTSVLKEGSELWDGIVEEQFKTKSDLLNPIKFFGHPLIMPYRMWQVYSDTKQFLDYKTIEPYFASEVHIKS